ncbi:DUF7827 domain-containing protein [Haloarchaeobius amylolyticus]|uniref:DUF7827 domain-containing protein n=1 Tax=Haloarchaeobius amylolyticus TaxID=1198296 RepID=UPI00227015E9|nr:PGF-CTERM sorting domain-containing protein [Haloarchaeobius amylolyticus]
MNRLALQSLCCLALVVVAAAGAPAVTADTQDASFDSDTYETTIDEEVTLTLSLTDAENATVTLGSEDAGYQMNVTVHDNDTDGQVQLTIYTQRLGIRAPAKSVAVAGNDTIVSAGGDTLGAAIDPGSYGLSLAVNGTETDTATLQVDEPATTTQPPTTTTQPPTTTAPPTTTTTAGGGGDGDGDEGGIPGFGIGVAVVALASVALLAHRQQ